MVLEIFTRLSEMLYTSSHAALLASLIWGILSVLLSPCHLASIPLIVGFIDGQKNMTTKRAFALSTLFSGGILITIAVIGLITGLMGRMLGDLGKIGNYSVAVIFFIVGLHLLGVIPLPFLENAATPGVKKKGALAAFMLGLVFGIALGPCTFAYMAPMLGVAFSVASSNLVLAIMLVTAYALGHCSVIIFAGTFTEYLQKYLNWSENSKGTIIVKKICGSLVILGGIYLVYTAQS
ncbi:MAG: cytochrome C biogenesis protein [Spirochaetae bacterium HGW-Spirochaetae-1]|jgi:cytochrome c-type biogenesis protein|nr:MAG: cytochrome C biogenesis protein [Spirochaetae bacterium HGW-Spirochaetae-1]